MGANQRTGDHAAVSERRSDAGGADNALLADVLGGDQRAWGRFCKRYERLIVGCVLRVLRRYGAQFDEADLADLVGEVWLALLRDDRHKLRQYDASRGYRLSSWIGLIASNSTIDQLRARSVPHAYLEDIGGHDQLPGAPEASPDARFERRERLRIATRALEELSCEEQRFVTACFGDERAPAELADELGVRLNTIYSRKFKLRAKLTRIAAALAGDDSVGAARLSACAA